ncbi:hypothetical protein SA22_1411 [Salmonella enterica subsp. enterica serovar Agona str. 22.H.04]|uniref:Uncharacterized protein n=1 Tax=Salmonella agona (strain SL483) TaxID=454166 RepID=B5EY76_SALA4|nr:hypothetical protein SeAg_B4028 [Salmonella enterica subsp. enterica serovar Agona str. SL483]EDZ31057.1 hypothetical protein SeW_A4253 [Salmonella enterica subsp. enterica serovar Weltevreden str. HI_N05-537]CCR00340.1 hypothetical protein SA73_1556 [Salmonella enterica subsp. enterica serovar Agona str. 73.H.09]CCR06643.1 hypothetical protein SA72_3222 [Salmonella enterica subsp. enterica serovar Agona str. 72.A.52]CCR09468.1 hypothetical protein SA71_1437 [Salmonella enterica subsp. enter
MKWNNTWQKDANTRSVPERRLRHPARHRLMALRLSGL